MPDPNLIEQTIRVLQDGVDQGATNVITLGTSAAAVQAWRHLRPHLTRRKPSPDTDEQAVLIAEPGQQIDLEVLRRLLEVLPPIELSRTVTVHGDYVAGNKEVHGDYVGRDKNVYNFNKG
jgi:hypothetical protein